MELLFARHGNTFNPGDKVVWVGRETDLPLVEKGRAQAEALGRALARAGLAPGIVYAASLKRTREFAAIIAGLTGNPRLVIDERLDEIDYGPLGGLSTEEIEAVNPKAKDLLDAWGKTDVWPEGLGWASRKAEILEALRAFVVDRLSDPEGARPLVVSSNGTLRFLPRLLLPQSLFRPSFKLRTGGLGILEKNANNTGLRCWDVGPEALD